MKHTANLWRDQDGNARGLVLANDNPLLDVTVTPLYTAHEIADFVKGLYFDDDFRLDKDIPVFAQIAEKIEKESQK